jgi:hypothetical protein
MFLFKRINYRENLKYIGNMVHKKMFTEVGYKCIKLNPDVYNLFPNNCPRQELCSKIAKGLNRHIGCDNHRFLIKEDEFKIYKQQDIFDKLSVDNDYIFAEHVILASSNDKDWLTVKRSIYFNKNVAFTSSINNVGDSSLLLQVVGSNY